jgi:hypothetical protein
VIRKGKIWWQKYPKSILVVNQSLGTDCWSHHYPINTLIMGPKSSLEILLHNHKTLRKHPEKLAEHFDRGGNLK